MKSIYILKLCLDKRWYLVRYEKGLLQGSQTYFMSPSKIRSFSSYNEALLNISIEGLDAYARRDEYWRLDHTYEENRLKELFVKIA